MSPLELAKMCEERIARYKDRGYSSKPLIQLVMVRETKPTGRKTKMFGTRGPLGTVDLVRPLREGGYRVIAAFDAQTVLNYLNTNLRKAA